MILQHIGISVSLYLSMLSFDVTPVYDYDDAATIKALRKEIKLLENELRRKVVDNDVVDNDVVDNDVVGAHVKP